jgi:hypothetical protein
MNDGISADMFVTLLMNSDSAVKTYGLLSEEQTWRSEGTQL